ncbi:MAG TPA: hypothetical protein VEQ62_06590 [Stellaceae bacterium]|nr:hypothetical protein [Stellaceae bacterium]
MSIFTITRVAGLAMLLGVTSCSGPPWTVEQSRDTITLRWYADETDSAVADSLAQAHCASSSKSVELVSYDQDGSAQIGRYRCR